MSVGRNRRSSTVEVWGSQWGAIDWVWENRQHRGEENKSGGGAPIGDESIAYVCMSALDAMSLAAACILTHARAVLLISGPNLWVAVRPWTSLRRSEGDQV